MYFYFLFPLSVWLISQTCKLIIRKLDHEAPEHLKSSFWTYMWAGGSPSTHTALLTSSLSLIWNKYGASPLFTFSLVVCMLWLFDIAEKRKKQEMINHYYKDETSGPHKEIVTDGNILDMSGHTFGEIFYGALLGITLATFAINIFKI